MLKQTLKVKVLTLAIEIVVKNAMATCVVQVEVV